MTSSIAPTLLAAGEWGGFVSWWKPWPILLVFLVWTRLLSWIDKDVRVARLPREGTNSGMLAGMGVALLLFFVMPNYWAGVAALFGVFVVEAGIYLAVRNNSVGLADLKQSLKDEFTFGKDKKKAELKAAEGEVVLYDASNHGLPPPPTDDPLRPAYEALQQTLADPIGKGAQLIEVTPIAGGAGQARYWVDGFRYEGAQLSPQGVGDGLMLLKDLIGLDANERRKIQKGKLKVTDGTGKHEVRVTTLGSKEGETARFEIDVPQQYTGHRPESIGLTQEQLDALKAEAGEPGLVLLAAPKGHGLTSLQYAMLRLHDALIYHIMTMEREPPADVESIKQNKLDANATPEEEAKLAGWLGSQEPDVLLAGGLESKDAARALAYLAGEKRIYVGVRASDVAGAVGAWRKLVGDDELALKSLRTVVVGRLFRKLCEATKEPYQPDEAVLKKLGLSAGQASASVLYRPHFGPLVDARGNQVPDTFCNGLGYKGRFGVYEVLDTTDSETKAALAQPGMSSSGLRQLFRKQKQRFLQELALRRVTGGETSVEEFVRVMQGDKGDRPASDRATPVTSTSAAEPAGANAR